MVGDVFSRARLAGYEPQLLSDSKVAVIGLGALGQNVIQSLALSGVRNIVMIDFDRFEDHNATRSPFFPRVEDSWGSEKSKAKIVCDYASRVATASELNFVAVDAMVQTVGDGVVRWADVIVCAVDSMNARAWLAERCRLHGKPMVEGGFSGERFNLSGFSGESGRPCYRCLFAFRESSASCTRYALAAEAANIVPAIQSTASVAGGVICELVIDILHGADHAFSKRLYGDIRQLDFNTAKLQLDPNCPGEHDLVMSTSTLPYPTDGTVGFLMELLGRSLGHVRIVLSEPLVIRHSCVVCGRSCSVGNLESVWLSESRCRDCGGPYEIYSESASPQIVTEVDVIADLFDENPLKSITLDLLGIRPGGSVLCENMLDERILVLFEGEFLTSFTLGR